MKVDNFNQIKALLDFENTGDFYFIQILKRRKENPDMKKDVKYIDDFFIFQYDMENWDLIKEKIIEKCDKNNARAYIRLNRRNEKKIALETLRLLADKVANEDYSNFQNAYISACGKYNSEPEKKWIIDIDVKDEKVVKSVCLNISYLMPDIMKDKVITVIPTVNGYHIISKPFHIQQFRTIFKDIDVHKDNPTLLYY